VFEDGKVNFNSCIFKDGNLNFSNTNFGHGGINFKNVVIGDGIKDFQYAYFGNGDVMFANTDFGNGDISFINSNFGNGEVSFKIAVFGSGNIDFHYSIFGNGDISFERAEFGPGRVDFRKVEFGSGKINFNKAVFNNGEINFEAAEMDEGKLLFKKTFFGNGEINLEEVLFPKSEVSFEKAIFGKGDVSFYKSKFHTLSLKSCKLNNYIDLRIEQSSLLELNDTVVHNIIDMIPHDFEMKINVIDFSGMRLIGQIYIDWKKNRLKEMIYNQTKTSYSIKAEQFNLLKQNFNHIGKYNDEDFAYIEFRRNEEKADLENALKKSSWNKFWIYPSYYFRRLVFDKMGLYATSPLRVFMSVIVMWFIFGLLFSLFHYIGIGMTWSSVGNPDKVTIIGQSFYHSAITFFTIGYGDVYPQGLSRLLSALEGFTGVFMMSYFTVSFVRKVLR